jgi:hypothetical protein
LAREDRRDERENQFHSIGKLLGERPARFRRQRDAEIALPARGAPESQQAIGFRYELKARFEIAM